MTFAYDGLLEKIAGERLSGIITARNSSVRKRVVAADGKIIMVESSDRRDLIGQAMIRAGLISEADLAAALEESERGDVKAGPGPKLTRVLTAMKKITAEQSRSVFESKVFDAAAAIYLWDRGTVTFDEQPVSSLFPLSIDIARLRSEGKKRRDRWKAAKATLPDGNMAFVVASRWPDGFPSTRGDSLLADLIERGASLNRILAEFHGQDYAITVRVADFVRKGILESCETTARSTTIEVSAGVIPGPVSEANTGAFSTAPAPAVGAVSSDPPPPEDADAIEVARKLASEGDLAAARKLLSGMIDRDPLQNPAAWDELQKIENAMADAARDAGIRDEVELALARPLHELQGRVQNPTEAFVISRFAAGPRAVGALLSICPMPSHEVLWIVKGMVAEGLLRRR